MIELSVAVVTAAIILPLGFYLGRLYERERAELRRPPAPHEALRPLLSRDAGGYIYGEGRRPVAPREILAELRGPLGKGPGVSAVTTTLWTYRRCGTEETVQGTGRPRYWVTAKFVGLNPPTTVTDIGDLCNQCGGYLVSFVHGTDAEDIARDQATDLALAEINAEVDASIADEIWRTGRVEQWGSRPRAT